MAKVLIVDDEADIRDILTQLFAVHGHDVDNAEDGQVAWQLYQQKSYDLVITDILMSNMDGLELTKHIHAINPDAKIIAISGGGKEHNLTGLETAKALGVNATIEKPFDLNNILETASSLLA